MDRRPSRSSGERLYHYTDDRGLKGIENSQQINPSTDSHRDAHFGTGVYFTGKTPRSRAENLLKNNYDGMNPGRHGAHRVKHAVSVSVDDLPDAEKVNVHGRDVWVHPGPVDLSQVDYKVHHKNISKFTGVGGGSGSNSRYGSINGGSSRYSGERTSYWEHPSTSNSNSYSSSSRSTWERPGNQWDNNSSWCSTGSDRRYSESSQACNYYEDSDDDWY